MIALSGCWASVGMAQDAAPEEILPSIQEAYGRGIDCIASHDFDGTEPNRPASSFCNGVIDEMFVMRDTSAYHLMASRDRQCFSHLFNVFWGSYEISRLEAGGEPGNYGRTPEEAKVMIMSDEHQIGALNGMGS